MNHRNLDWTEKQALAEKAGLQDMKYYVVEIANAVNNPIHRVIAFHRHIGDLIIFSAGGYQHGEEISYFDLYHFKVLEGVSLMNEAVKTSLPPSKRYIHAKTLFISSGFEFQKGEKVEVICEEMDSYLFVNHKGRNDQMSKVYLKEHPELNLINEYGEPLDGDGIITE